MPSQALLIAYVQQRFARGYSPEQICRDLAYEAVSLEQILAWLDLPPEAQAQTEAAGLRVQAMEREAHRPKRPASAQALANIYVAGPSAESNEAVAQALRRRLRAEAGLDAKPKPRRPSKPKPRYRSQAAGVAGTSAEAYYAGLAAGRAAAERDVASARQALRDHPKRSKPWRDGFRDAVNDVASEAETQ